VPVQDAKWLQSGKQVMSPTLASSRAAPVGPMQCKSLTPVPVSATRVVSSLSASVVPRQPPARALHLARVA
jgi:hypothetical protein